MTAVNRALRCAVGRRSCPAGGGWPGRSAMRTVVLCALSLLVLQAAANEPQQLANPSIDSAGYLRMAADAATHRESRRVSEDEFIRLARTRGTVILDARSRAKYEALHVRGAA